MRLGLLEFVLLVFAGGGLFFAVRDDLQVRDRLTLAEAASSLSAGSRSAEATASGKAETACLQGSASGFRAGQLAARIAAPSPRPVSGPRPMIGADELAQEVQP